MKTAVYPGSFNPWHQGHSDILRKALKVFDKVIVAVGRNPEKSFGEYNIYLLNTDFKKEVISSQVETREFSILLVDFIKNTNACAVIRGLRNGSDLQYEQNQQYWNEDLGLNIPTIYFICDRKLSHISSSTIRAVNMIKGINT